MDVSQVCNFLEQRKRNLRCKELSATLVDLGFCVKDGKRGGHKVLTHDGLADFYSQSFNCGHGKNPEIKPAYISKIISLLREYEQPLNKFLKERGHD